MVLVAAVDVSIGIINLVCLRVHIFSFYILRNHLRRSIRADFVTKARNAGRLWADSASCDQSRKHRLQRGLAVSQATSCHSLIFPFSLPTASSKLGSLAEGDRAMPSFSAKCISLHATDEMRPNGVLDVGQLR